MQSCHLPTSRRSYQEKVGTVLITVLLLYYYRTSANQLHILLTILSLSPTPTPSSTAPTHQRRIAETKPPSNPSDPFDFNQSNPKSRAKGPRGQGPQRAHGGHGQELLRPNPNGRAGGGGWESVPGA